MASARLLFFSGLLLLVLAIAVQESNAGKRSFKDDFFGKDFDDGFDDFFGGGFGKGKGGKGFRKGKFPFGSKNPHRGRCPSRPHYRDLSKNYPTGSRSSIIHQTGVHVPKHLSLGALRLSMAFIHAHIRLGVSRKTKGVAVGRNKKFKHVPLIVRTRTFFRFLRRCWGKPNRISHPSDLLHRRGIVIFFDCHNTGKKNNDLIRLWNEHDCKGRGCSSLLKSCDHIFFYRLK